MLVLDCETTGLDGYKNQLTCACFFDSDNNTQHSFVFDQPPHSEDSLRKQATITCMLDEATQLSGFNACKFDLPFLAKNWKLSDTHLVEWLLKTVDIYEASRLALKITFPLNALLAANGLESKSGSGLEAIRLAHDKKWDELANYCMQDVILTHEVTTLTVVNLPTTSLKWSIQKSFFH